MRSHACETRPSRRRMSVLQTVCVRALAWVLVASVLHLAASADAPLDLDASAAAAQAAGMTPVSFKLDTVAGLTLTVPPPSPQSRSPSSRGREMTLQSAAGMGRVTPSLASSTPGRAFHAFSTANLSTIYTFAAGSYQVTSVIAANTSISLGYWFRTLGSANNMSVLFMKDTEYTKYQAGTAFTYYTTYSRANTKLASMSTVNFETDDDVRLVMGGVMTSSGIPASTTVQGAANLFTGGSCVSSVTCQNGGICDTGSVCACPPTWSGTDCTTPVCSQGCVSGQGTCTAPDVCECNFGYSGSSCAGIDGNYSAWGNLSSCEPVSDTGDACQQVQTRTCTNPTPANGGADCSAYGAATRSYSCTCSPQDGGWTDWYAGSCSTGTSACTLEGTRTCTNPVPRFNGTDCTGDSSMTLICTCPTSTVSSSTGAAGSNSTTTDPTDDDSSSGSSGYSTLALAFVAAVATLIWWAVFGVGMLCWRRRQRKIGVGGGGGGGSFSGPSRPMDRMATKAALYAPPTPASTAMGYPSSTYPMQTTQESPTSPSPEGGPQPSPTVEPSSPPQLQRQPSAASLIRPPSHVRQTSHGRFAYGSSPLGSGSPPSVGVGGMPPQRVELPPIAAAARPFARARTGLGLAGLNGAKGANNQTTPLFNRPGSTPAEGGDEEDEYADDPHHTGGW